MTHRATYLYRGARICPSSYLREPLSSDEWIPQATVLTASMVGVISQPKAGAYRKREDADGAAVAMAKRWLDDH